MEPELRRSLAKREMIRASQFENKLTIPPTTAVALRECLQMYLNTPSEIIDDAQRSLVFAFINGIASYCSPLGAPTLAEWLRSGHSELPMLHIFGHSTLELFTVFSAASRGALVQGDCASSLIVVHMANKFADSIEENFPTLAEMIRENHREENYKPIPERLLRDTAGRRAAHG